MDGVVAKRPRAKVAHEGFVFWVSDLPLDYWMSQIVQGFDPVEYVG